MNTYRIHDLIVKSTIKTPYLPQVDKNCDAQVYIKYGEIPRGIDGDKNMRTEVSAQKFIFVVDGIAKFYVCDGKQIIVSPAKGVAEDVVMLFLLGTPWAVLLLQRGFLPLDGSAIVDKDKGIVFIGRSAAGKSSVVLALHNKNYAIISDEMCVVDNTLNIVPGTGYLQTWKKTLLKLKMEDEYPRVRPVLEKYYIALNQRQVQEPVPIKSIFILNPINQDKYVCESICGIDKVTRLRNSVWGQMFVHPLKVHVANFTILTSLAQAVTLKRIDYPSNFLLQRAVEFIENEFVDE